MCDMIAAESGSYYSSRAAISSSGLGSPRSGRPEAAPGRGPLATAPSAIASVSVPPATSSGRCEVANFGVWRFGSSGEYRGCRKVGPRPPAGSHLHVADRRSRRARFRERAGASLAAEHVTAPDDHRSSGVAATRARVHLRVQE